MAYIFIQSLEKTGFDFAEEIILEKTNLRCWILSNSKIWWINKLIKWMNSTHDLNHKNQFYWNYILKQTCFESRKTDILFSKNQNFNEILKYYLD